MVAYGAVYDGERNPKKVTSDLGPPAINYYCNKSTFYWIIETSRPEHPRGGRAVQNLFPAGLVSILAIEFPNTVADTLNKHCLAISAGAIFSSAAVSPYRAITSNRGAARLWRPSSSRQGLLL
jgi:hypothetical protein